MYSCVERDTAKVAAMRLEIQDCVFKPCEAAELRAKALAAQKRTVPPETTMDSVVPRGVKAPPAPAVEPEAGR
jgi:DNA-binding response OmpR family regulator